jgi:hypothetical protein
MSEATEPREPAARERPQRQEPSWILTRPDRAAMWAFLLALFVMVFAALSSARAAESGGIGESSSDVPVGPIESEGAGTITEDDAPAGEQEANERDTCEAADFGERVLKMGDCGTDVKTLNWILRASQAHLAIASRASRSPLKLGRRFGEPTDGVVRAIQADGGLRKDGVVDSDTRGALKHTMSKEIATWYGPGFYGSTTACGQTLSKRMIGVAHRTLPCGTKVTVAYGGEFVRARVIDRGPYANDANWDLTLAMADLLGFTEAGVDKVRVAPIR